MLVLLDDIKEITKLISQVIDPQKSGLDFVLQKDTIVLKYQIVRNNGIWM